MNRIFQELVKTRGLSSDFISPKYFSEPEIHKRLPDIEKALDEIENAILKNQKIMVYGDYDVDGVTATTVMVNALKLAGVKSENIITMLPDRFIDGYGMSERCIKRAKDEKIDLIITVDCGSNNSEVISKLNEQKIKTIVTDHHEIMGKLPEALAVVNPKRDHLENIEDLAGVGVAFMVARGLVERGRIKDGQEKWLLDLVLIGTLCDSMNLTKLNRELTFYGLKVLKKTHRPGLKELMRVSKIKEINSEVIGFQLGPRLNAGGRLKSAEISLKLLMTDSKTEAVKLANELNELNTNRQTEQRSALKEIAERETEIMKNPVVVVSGDWHEGVLGIIAGRLVEKYHKPAFVLSKIDDFYKGSGRSFGEFNLANALKNCQENILGGGGHAAACGLSVSAEKLLDFTEDVNAYYKSLELKNQEEFLKIKADLNYEDLADFSVELLDNLSELEPFGEGNKEPRFKLLGVKVLGVKKLGKDENHLKLTVGDKDNKKMNLISFFAPEKWLDLKTGQNLDITASLFKNEWNGKVSVEGRILDIEYGIIE
ncbi:single-stranded-DNA-specific exonuclease RecJ [Candidatus Saccharibacteria bacterium]|nr:single-stranded-DNA-specific exonuclease RecJ [Candidatus Saccharibacteria bacterium]